MSVNTIFHYFSSNMLHSGVADGCVIGNWALTGINGNGQSLINLCMGRGLPVMKPFFRHKVIHKYTCEIGEG